MCFYIEHRAIGLSFIRDNVVDLVKTFDKCYSYFISFHFYCCFYRIYFICIVSTIYVYSERDTRVYTGKFKGTNPPMAPNFSVIFSWKIPTESISILLKYFQFQNLMYHFPEQIIIFIFNTFYSKLKSCLPLNECFV